MVITIQAACHCGTLAQDLHPRSRVRAGDKLEPASSALDLTLCHCSACRHTTGVLCTSYFPIEKPAHLSGAVAHNVSPTSTVYFCGTCGCHVFRRVMEVSASSPARDSDETDIWEVATGAVASGPGPSGGGSDDSNPALALRIAAHVGREDTVDGGLSVWLRSIPDNGASPSHMRQPAIASLSSLPDPNPMPDSEEPRSDGVLQASCHCGTVRFHITRPDASSRLPKSNFPDLMIPYHAQSPSIRNPDDTKWWLRPAGKYLAGTCACRSCRLISGFEIQTWAFVPRGNIFFRKSPGPLEFDALHASGVLKAYESSPGVIREFCPACGATVFWHDKWRPDLIDVSVGLLSDPSGVRAESWLDWWKERVSFSEEAGAARRGAFRELALDLVGMLEEGLRKGEVESGQG